MDLQRRQTTWLGETNCLSRESPNPGTTTPEVKKDKKRPPPPLRLSAHPSAWAKSASSLGRLGDSQRSLKLIAEDPWHHYKKIVEVCVGSAAVLAEREDSGDALFAIRCLRHQPREAEAKLYMIQVLQHEHFQMVLEVFLWSGELCIVSPYIQISVFEIIRAYLRPSEAKVACVARQALDGMVYLEANGFIHGHITAENLLLEDTGQLRIAQMEDCHKAGDAEDQSAGVRKLGVIVVQLMEKDTTINEETVVLKRPKEWSESAIGFVRDSSSLAARNLLGHPFLKISCAPTKLAGLIAAAKFSTYRPWNPCEDA